MRRRTALTAAWLVLACMWVPVSTRADTPSASPIDQIHQTVDAVLAS